jgi:hypothetical protein
VAPPAALKLLLVSVASAVVLTLDVFALLGLALFEKVELFEKALVLLSAPALPEGESVSEGLSSTPPRPPDVVSLRTPVAL